MNWWPGCGQGGKELKELGSWHGGRERSFGNLDSKRAR